MAKPQNDMVDLAMHLIEEKSTALDPPKFEHHYCRTLKEIVQEKLKGHAGVAKAAERPATGNAVDLMEALRRSVEPSSRWGRMHV